MVKGNKSIVAHQLVKQQNQLDDHNEVKKIIREELMNHIQGAGFWDSLKANLGGTIGHASAPVAPTAAPMQMAEASKPAKAPKKARKINPKMAERYALIKQLMKTEGLTMPQASKRAAEIQNKA